jgi:hypothetical protein
VLCVRVLAPTEGLGGAALVGGVLQMVSEPTLAVVRTDQCADIGRMTPEMGHTTWHMGRHWMYDRALRGKVLGHLLGGGGECHTRLNLDGP